MLKPLSVARRSELEALVAECEASLPSAGEYLEGRGISRDTAGRFRLGVVPPAPSAELRPYVGRLAIPSYSGGGVESIRFRALGESTAKMLGFPGAETRIFNTRALFEYGNVMAIAEGEIDAMILTQCGIPAVGVPGVNNWKRHHGRLFQGFSDVLIFGDNDKAGQDFVTKLIGDIPTGKAIVFGEDGEDVNDYFMRMGGFDGGDAAVRLLAGLS